MDNNEHKEETAQKRFSFVDGTPACEFEYSTEEHRVYKMKATIEFHKIFPAKDSFQTASRKMAEEMEKYPREISDMGRVMGITMERTETVLPDEEEAFDWVFDTEKKWRESGE